MPWGGRQAGGRRRRRPLVSRLTAALVFAVLLALPSGLGACIVKGPGPTPPPGPTPAATGQVAPLPMTSAETSALNAFAGRLIDMGAPAVTVEVRASGRVWSGAYGYQNLQAVSPARASDRLPVARITEAMVAVSLMRLVEDGTVGLEDPVSKHLDEFDELVHPPEPVTVRELMQHTAGLPDFLGPLLRSKPLKEALGSRISIDDALRLAGTEPWRKSLIHGYRYSTSDFLVLARIVEKHRGKPIGNVLQAEIIDPLGLKRTSLTSGLGARDVRGFVIDGGGYLDVTRPAVLESSPAVGVVSSAGDVNDFFGALLTGKLVRPSTVREMETVNVAYVGLGLAQWSDTCSGGFYHGQSGEVWGFGSVSMASTDGTRQVTILFAYPPAPVPTPYVSSVKPLLVEVQGRAQDVLNSLCPGQPVRRMP